MVEVAKRNNASKRTIYRYKNYYDKMKKPATIQLIVAASLHFELAEFTMSDVPV